MRSFVTGRDVPLRFVVDPAVLTTGITELAAANRVEPTEPTIATTGGAVTVVAGIDGAAIDPDALAATLVDAADAGITPIRVTADPAPTPPRFSDTDAQAVADQATAATATPLALEIGGKSATVVSDTLRSWVTAVPGPTALELQADQAKIVADLPTLVTDLGVAPVPASFNVVPDGDNPFGKVEIVDGQLGVECCAPDSAQRIAAALVAGQHTAALDLWPRRPRARQEVGREPRHRPADQLVHHPPRPAASRRVINIHRIADIGPRDGDPARRDVLAQRARRPAHRREGLRRGRR